MKQYSYVYDFWYTFPLYNGFFDLDILYTTALEGLHSTNTLKPTIFSDKSEPITPYTHIKRINNYESQTETRYLETLRFAALRPRRQ